MTIRTACATIALLAVPASAGAATPRVETMVVGKGDRVLAAARTRTAKADRAGGCGVPAATPLAALTATPLRLRVTDDGACSPSSLFVTQVGSERNRGQGGWVYKVGGRAGTTAASDPSGPFGTGRRLRSGDRVLWFYCLRATACQRTLAVSARRAGSDVRASVRGFDDQGRSVAVVGATVDVGGVRAVTGADGAATVTSPGSTVVATKPGLVRSFPERVA